MKLVTFQSYEALKNLINNGYLECDEKYLNIKKYGLTYNWVLNKMIDIENPTNAKYPIWAWVKCYNSICPQKHKGKTEGGYDVKITFHKDEKDVFITDYRRYSFLLNNLYIPNTIKEKEQFNELLKLKNISEEELKAFVRTDKYPSHRTDKEFLDVCDKIRKSFDRCITLDSDILQGCVWRINYCDIEKIEVLNNKNYIYGSLNYLRYKGKRIDWQKDLYRRLK